MTYIRIDEMIIDDNDIFNEADLKLLSEEGTRISTNIEDLLEVGDIGSNSYGTIFVYREPAHKTEFLNLCDTLYFKNKNGFTKFAYKENGIWLKNYLG